MAQRKRYCKIKFCENEIGTLNHSFKFFRIPTHGKYRQEWIDAISKHQSFENQTYYSVCSLHFNAEDIIEKGKKSILKENAIPCKFKSVNNNNNDVSATVHYQRNMATSSTLSKTALITNNTNENNNNVVSAGIVGLRDVNHTIQDKRDLNFYRERCIKLEVEKIKLEGSVDLLTKKCSQKEDRIRKLEHQVDYYKNEQTKLKSLFDDRTMQNAIGINDSNKEIFECLLGKTKCNIKYSEAIRSFSITMHLHSPSAYNFLRRKFNSNLPHESTIRKWYANCGTNGMPGIQKECLQTLATLVTEHQQNNKELYCSLAFDEMSINEVVQWSEAKKKFIGYTTYGQKDKNGNQPVATHAIVFLLSGIDSKFSIPVAYHFISALNTEDKAKLLIEVITSLSFIGVKIVNVTFDGWGTNFSVCRRLGASFDIDNLKPFFPNPITGAKIYIILDPCHMLKLWRNTLANHQLFVDGKDQKIKWVHFERLEDRGYKNEFVVHKLTKKHILWYKDKMNVKLACQTLSNSVSSALSYLLNNDCIGFKDCAGTVEFTKRANDMFDIFNTNIPKNDEAIQYNEYSFKKLMLNEANENRIFTFLDETADYIKQIKLHQENITSTLSKTGFIGFLINIESLKCIFRDYVETGLLQQIPTLRLSQDFLESFFGRIRALLGSNHWPTQEQYISAFRKLSVNSELISSPFSNCKDMLSILTISSRKSTTEVGIEVIPSEEEIENVNQLHRLCEQDYLLDIYQRSSMISMAGYIETNILTAAHFECFDCKKVLEDNDKVNAIDCVNLRKARTPCKSTVDICTVASKYAKIFQREQDFSYQMLVNLIMRNINFDSLFFNSVEHKEGHMYFLVKFIVEEFVRTKFHYIAKTLTLEKQKKFLIKKIKRMEKYK